MSQKKDKPNDKPQESTGREIPQDTEKQTGSPAKTAFPIVGIGASAGGIAAFEAFFTHLATDDALNMAFVIVQHLDPTHESILSDLVQAYTTLPVAEAADGVRVEPNAVYIIPPNKDMALLHGRLQLMEPSLPRGLRLPIDFFFRSLAQDQREQAVGIILSGTGTDGTLGLRTIKENGGMVIAQTPETAAYDGMPASAVATGLVDFTLPPEKMPAQLTAYTRHSQRRPWETAVPALPETDDALRKIFLLLRDRTGHDFSQYKKNTVHRRIARRLAVHQIDGLTEYGRYLRHNGKEVQTLLHELLISVTQFFRDPDAFAALKEQVIPQLFQHKKAGQPIRVWVPGCATGEEAYSIAILLQEYAEHTLAAHRLSDNLFQIFATDIDDHVIETARAGVYPESIAADVAQERLRRFFTKDGVTYQVKQSIRDKIVFATQSIIKDPPFSRLDMISCRNLLIYLGADLQEKILPLFHYALNPGGVLFLGSSETIGNFRDLFAVVDGKWKLYRHKGEATMRLPGMRFAVPTLPGERQAGGTAVPDPAPPLQRLAETILLENFTAACVIVNEKLEILYTHGRTGRYLEPAQGKADWTIASMARSGLGLDLRTALRKARARNQPVRYENITLKTNGSEARINLIVKPIQEPPALQGLMAIVFEEVTLPAAIQQELDASPTSNDERVVRLEGELRATRAHLQAANEELETTNEELKSTNEELQLSLEEVQSANEELRTSQEELRSVNEELLTANAELSHKMAALTQANNDMSNLVANTDIGVVFVDTDLMVQFFTPAATRTVHLIDSDIGRPLSHIATNLQYDALITDVQTLLRTLSPQEFEAQSEDGRRYLVRLRPYRTAEYAIGGAVITFIDITNHMTAEMRRLATVTQDSNDAVTVQDRHGRILAWNRGAEKMYGYAKVDALQMNIRDIVPEAQREIALAQIEQIFAGETIDSLETFRQTKGGDRLDVWLTATALTDEQGRVTAIATTERDITRRKQMEADMRAGAEHNQMVLQTALDGFWLLDAAGTILEVNDAYCHMIGYSRDEVLGKHVSDFEAIETPEETADRIQKVIATGGDHFETQHKCKDGRIIDLSISVSYMDVEGGRFVGFMRDITERKQTEKQIKRHAALLEEVADAIIATDQNFIIESWNQAAETIYGWRQDEAIGQQVDELTRQEYIDETREDVIRQFMEQGVWRGEVLQYHKNGSKLRIQAAVTLIKDEDGNPVGVVAVNRPAPRGEYHDQKARQTQ